MTKLKAMQEHRKTGLDVWVCGTWREWWCSAETDLPTAFSPGAVRFSWNKIDVKFAMEHDSTLVPVGVA